MIDPYFCLAFAGNVSGMQLGADAVTRETLTSYLKDNACWSEGNNIPCDVYGTVVF